MLRKEDNAGTEIPCLWQIEITDLAVVGIRRLDHQASAVTIQGVGTHGTTMGQVAKYFNATLDDRVAFTAFDVGDKTDTTVVVFVSGIGERKHGLLFLLRVLPSCTGDWSEQDQKI
jgi:hypothetical protein